MDSELLFRFFEGLTTDSEDQTIKEWFEDGKKGIPRQVKNKN